MIVRPAMSSILLFLVQTALSAGRRQSPRDANYLPYLPDCRILFFDNFSTPDISDRWTPSTDPRYQSQWHSEALFQRQGRKGERGLILKSRGASSAIGHRFRHPIDVRNQTFIIQYEVRAQFAFTCASAFIRIYNDTAFNASELSNDTIPLIEFGPERCGDFNQSRFITYTFENKLPTPHSVTRPHFIPIDEYVHLYTLIVRPDGTFETLIDNRSTRNGTVSDDFIPPLFENPLIDDPTDHKPPDWVDDVLIPDVTHVKPASWDENEPREIVDPAKATPPPGWLFDEPLVVPDPTDKKPDSWDDEKMGEWIPRPIGNIKCLKARGCGPYKPPMLRNRKYRGIWKQRLIPNPAYKGEWRPRKIPNPNYHGQSYQFVMPPIVGIGFDIWTDQSEFAFTNILIATDEKAIKKWNSEDFSVRQRIQVKGMRINYGWIRTDLPDDLPDPGIIGHVDYYLRRARVRWGKLHNKPIYIAITAVLLVILILIVLLFCYACESDPFSKMKTD
jgi:calnexin